MTRQLLWGGRAVLVGLFTGLAHAQTNSTDARLKHLESMVSSLQAQLNAANESANGVDSGNTGFMIVCTALVLFMNIPGLALFYGGMAGAKHVLSVVMQTFSITCLVSVIWFIFGYSLAFGRGSPFLGGSERFWLYGNGQRIPRISLTSMSELSSPTRIPESVFIMYQCTFAIITSSLMCGSFAERMRFFPTMVFVFFWHVFVYCPVAHWSWAPDGFLNLAGVLDFAGGSVVHISSGMSGLVAAIVVGKRQAFKDHQPSPPHNILLTLVGGSMLWVGWFGFNAGSALGANSRAGFATLATNIAAGTGGLVWMLLESIERNKPPSVLGAVSGAIGGLVCITPGSGFVDHTGAFFTALLGVPICFLGVKLKHRLGYDDALDAFGVHGVGGIAGGVLTGFFANDAISGSETARGAFYGRPVQIGFQIYGIVVITGWAVCVSYVILRIIDATMGLRVSLHDEEEGLDITQHGETIVAVHRLSNADAGGLLSRRMTSTSEFESAANAAFNSVYPDGAAAADLKAAAAAVAVLPHGGKAGRVAPAPALADDLEMGKEGKAAPVPVCDEVEYLDGSVPHTS